MSEIFLSTPACRRLRARYANVPWGAVRADYEQTEISVRELARRYGLPATSLLRLVAGKRWARIPGGATARLVEAAVGLAADGRIAPRRRLGPETTAGFGFDPDMGEAPGS